MPPGLEKHVASSYPSSCASPFSLLCTSRDLAVRALRPLPMPFVPDVLWSVALSVVPLPTAFLGYENPR